eukprot:CAMPEP_0194755878 /NCGR_PEP_ID=MMETSP0323_2-20130528/9680_1 /TAXON_ID=2866 ORGANISM="Crypthecodinium cohnii, Strain Seligo" /NCGR_SAMPLE_ID=MMETSP0323_2 /ASSEMBLY_ACC=CAM_ASM_000346 /LENGTH=35 /DNA_ID= /DNA_START= /DNA_END= /DNA_ORIENTATION=
MSALGAWRRSAASGAGWGEVPRSGISEPPFGLLDS